MEYLSKSLTLLLAILTVLLGAKSFQQRGKTGFPSPQV